MPVRIKICGITRQEDAQFATRFGAEYLGFNFYQGSPRYLAPDVAASIIESLPAEITAVGVFVNASAAEVFEVAVQAKLRMLQFHGDETADFVRQFSAYKKVKALRVSSPEMLKHEFALWKAEVDFVLLDAAVPGSFGGTGVSLDNNLREALAAEDISRKILLAGGLTPENVAERAVLWRPWGVDVASGVEESPGIKSVDKLRAFCAAVQQAHIST